MGPSEEATAVLKPYPSDLMIAYEVSTRVNSVKNNSPDLIEPTKERGSFDLPPEADAG
jgi:putative SOS response-associated peptidase YedK